VTVYLVGAGPGDPGLLTRRGAAVLSTADVVVYDRLVDRALLALAPAHAELIDAGKEPSGRGGAPPTRAPVSGGPGRQDDIVALLVSHGSAGRQVVRLKGGDPFVFGRGGEEAEALAAAGVPFEVVPGVTSAFAVPAYAGVPVTHRGLATSVTVVTGHVGEATDSPEVRWGDLARAGGTIVILMGMATRAAIARRLVEGGRPPETPVAVVAWGTTTAQRSVRTTLAGLADVTLGSPAVIVVGPVAGLDLSGPAPRPLAGWSVVVTRPREQAGPLVGALTGAGAAVVELPTVEVTDPADDGRALRAAAVDVARYDWVAFTSANAVRRLLARLHDARAFGPARLAAVGRATASVLAEHGLVADLVATDPTAAGLAAAFPDAPPGGRVLFPRAAAAARSFPEGLRAKGWTVDEVVAYRTVPVRDLPPEVPTLVGGADAVVFTSPSTLEGYRSLTGADGRPLDVPPVVVCLGPVTASAARAAGFEVTVVADDPSPEGLVAALVAARRAPPPGTAP